MLTGIVNFTNQGVKMTAHKLSGGPSDETIRKMAATMSVAEMAETLGVTRPTVYYYLDRAGCEYPTRMGHKKYLPWRLHQDHANDGIAVALRCWSKEEQGGELTMRQRNRLRELRDHCAQGWVVDYTRDDGFYFVRRDPAIDDPDLPIRRVPPAS